MSKAREVIVHWWLGSDGREGSLPRWTSAAEENTDAILSALRAAGLVVVPVYPTQRMYIATLDAWEYHGSGFDQFAREYQAMIAASQEDKG